LINTTISGNSATFGGGVYSLGRGVMRFINCTIADNTAPRGSAFYTNWDTPPVFTNTLVVGHCAAWAGVSNLSEGGNIQSPAGDCYLDHPTDRLHVPDAGIGPLRYNGGRTLTHELLPGSPAIDTAIADACPEDDQRGGARPWDGDGDGVAGCDVGAYERVPRQPVVQVPALSPAGSLLLGLFVSASALLLLLRRRKPARTT
jgi:hypothetical protein